MRGGLGHTGVRSHPGKRRRKVIAPPIPLPDGDRAGMGGGGGGGGGGGFVYAYSLVRSREILLRSTKL